MIFEDMINAKVVIPQVSKVVLFPGGMKSGHVTTA